MSNDMASPDELRIKVNELLRSGLSETDVAQTLGVEVQTVRRLIGGQFCQDCE